MNTRKQNQFLLFAMATSVIISSCSKSSSGSGAGSGSGGGGGSTITVSTFVGSGTSGAGNGTGTAATFSFPASVIFNAGTMYVGDFGNSLVRTVNLTTTAVTTYAGSVTGFLNGAAASAKFNGSANIAFDASGNLYVADEENNVIREVSSAGAVTTLAGSGVAGYQDGNATTAQFNFPEGITTDGSGNLYVVDGHNNVVRKVVIATGAVSTYAGIAGAGGFTNGAVASATFNDPYGITRDASGNLYIADIKNNCIRKITVSTGMVSTYAGTGTQGLTNGTAATATFFYPLGCAFDSGGNLYVCDTYNNVIREVSASGTVTTFAGTGTGGSTDGAAATASFNFPIGIAVNGNGIYIADTHNNKIRKITVQ